ncbi:MAG: ABC transporter ATP-binding protein [Ruminococcaceae bacterium]|nr:ABC transporter ATP-binding protein [Oscillospiraceae bacterium]
MLRIYKNLQKKDVLIILLAAVAIAGQVCLELRLPDYMSEITTLVQTPGSEMSSILLAGGKMMLCAFGSLLSAVAVTICAARVASNFGSVIRAKLFDKVQSFSMAEIGRFSTSSLITRTTNDVMHVQMLIVLGLQSIIKAPMMAIWAITKISSKSSQWTFTTGVAVVILLIIVITVISLAMPKFKKLQVLTDDLNRVTRENLTGLRVVRAYNAEEYQENKFEAANEKLTKTHLFTGRVMAFMMPSIQLIMNGLALSIYWLGAALIESADMTEKITLFSDMIVFSQYAMQVVMSFMMLVMIFIILPRASVAARRILQVLDTPVSIKDGTVTASEAKGEIEFRNVSFRYPDSEEDMLQGISFSAHKGETVAFIGATGSGKSTLINLIPRFFDASEGEILVDGVNVKDYTLHALRSKIGYVSQKAILFSGTVNSNVAFGSGNDTENVKRAVHTAQAAEFVEKMPDGFDSYVAQGGSNLSGGQKQRLSIARAVCRKPEILIFDDSFSALDYKTDRTLRKQLVEDCKGSTKLIVAQRIGTIRDADRIVVLDEGRIAGIGTHNELMKSCDVYQQIAYSQLSKEELA